MKNKWKIVGSARLWALGSSLLLHSLVLVGLGMASYQATTSEPGETVVYLTMSSFGVSQNPQSEIVQVSPDVSQITRASSIEPSRQKLKIDRTNVAIGTNTTVEPVDIDQGLEVSNMKPPSPGEVAELVSAQFTEAEADPLSNSMEIAFPDDPIGTVNDSKDTVMTDHRSPITDHQGPLLAFVGDPVAAGIIPMTEGDNILAAKILSMPEPVYPTLSRRRGEEGRVVIKIRVSAQGAVRGAQIETSSSYPRLDRAALAAVNMAQFSPAREYGRPVESERIVAYVFRLEGM
jgi:TonB family protein